MNHLASAVTYSYNISTGIKRKDVAMSLHHFAMLNHRRYGMVMQSNSVLTKDEFVYLKNGLPRWVLNFEF